MQTPALQKSPLAQSPLPAQDVRQLPVAPHWKAPQVLDEQQTPPTQFPLLH